MARFSDGRKDAARGAVAGKKKRIYLAQFNRGDQVDQLAEAGSLGWMLGWSVAVRISTPGSPTFLSPPPPPTPPPEPSSIPRRPPLLPPPGLSTSLLLSFSLSLSLLPPWPASSSQPCQMSSTPPPAPFIDPPCDGRFIEVPFGEFLILFLLFSSLSREKKGRRLKSGGKNEY